MTDDDIDILEKTTAYQGFFKIDRYRLRHRIFDNDAWSGDMEREVFERGHAVGVLPFDPARDEVVLLEQFRVGAFAAPAMSAWQIECVAGIIDGGDKPKETAHRELGEETGLVARGLIPMHHYLCSPGGASETVQLYCARVDAEHAGGIHGQPEEDEYIRVFALPCRDAFAMLDDGLIGNSMTIIALQWLRHQRQQLRMGWPGASD